MNTAARSAELVKFSGLGAPLQFEQWASLGANLWAVLGTLATVGTRVALVHVTGGLQLDAAARRRFLPRGGARAWHGVRYDAPRHGARVAPLIFTPNV